MPPERCEQLEKADDAGLAPRPGGCDWGFPACAAGFGGSMIGSALQRDRERVPVQQRRAERRQREQDELDGDAQHVH